MIHPHNETPLRNKKTQTINTCSNINESQLLYAKGASMGMLHIVCIFFDILYKSQNYSNREQTVIPVAKGARSQYKGILLRGWNHSEFCL